MTIQTIKGMLLTMALTLQASVMASPSSFPENIRHFAFGSCAKERRPQPIWNEIAKTEPELFLFLGDNMYADWWLANGLRMSSAPVTKPERFKEAYDMLAAIPQFADFRSKTPFMGTWDDHDYGANDAGAEYSLKAESQEHFLDFFGFAKDDPIRQQKGIYHSRITGPVGQRVQFIMLDTRYHRDPLTENPDGRPEGKGPYLPDANPDASFLGDEQWQWLEEQLRQPADIRFISSSIQVVAYEHNWETWGNFPVQRQKLYDLIDSTKAEGVVFLSGDRHLTEASMDEGQLGANVPYPMWDFTSSGMTDEFSEVDEVNTFRQGAVYRGSHFATITIDWAEETKNSSIKFRALTEKGDLINEQIVKLSDLSF